jgi:hypothetical protein
MNILHYCNIRAEATIMSEEKNEKLLKFTGTCYTRWKRRVEMLIPSKDLENIVKSDLITINASTTAWMKKDNKAKYLYNASMISLVKL